MSENHFIYTNPGNRIRISMPAHKGKQRLDLRHEYLHRKTHQWRLGTNGIIFAVEQLDDLISALEELRDGFPPNAVAEGSTGGAD